MSEEQKTARDVALESLPPEMREALLKKASDLGVHRVDDVVWALVSSVITTEAAGAAAADAATRIEDATRNVGDTIYQQAVRAGKDLAEIAGKTIEDKTVEAGMGVVAGMRHAAATGAGELRAVVRGLPQAAAVQRATILEDWKTALVSMAVQGAEQRARRGGVVVHCMAFAMMLAGLAAGGYVGYHLAPQAWCAGSPPAAVWRFPKQNFEEFAWRPHDAVISRNCPAGDVCLDLRRRQ